MAILNENEIQRVPVTTHTQVVTMTAGSEREVTFTLRDRDGVPVALTTLTRAGESSSSESELVVTLTCKEMLSSNKKLLEITGEVTDAEAGEVTFVIPADDSINPGCYYADIGVTIDDAIVYVMPVYLEFRSSTFYNARFAPLAIYEVRLALRDHCPEANYLLDALEFSDDEIAFCIMRCVDEWNETPPPVSRFTYRSFPFRFHWLLGACGYLLRIAAAHYARNHLEYSAAGVSVNDKAKFSIYDQRAQQLIEEWRSWLVQQKLSMNLQSGFGSMTSSYDYSTILRRL